MARASTTTATCRAISARLRDRRRPPQHRGWGCTVSVASALSLETLVAPPSARDGAHRSRARKCLCSLLLGWRDGADPGLTSGICFTSCVLSRPAPPPAPPPAVTAWQRSTSSVRCAGTRPAGAMPSRGSALRMGAHQVDPPTVGVFYGVVDDVGEVASAMEAAWLSLSSTTAGNQYSVRVAAVTAGLHSGSCIAGCRRRPVGA